MIVVTTATRARLEVPKPYRVIEIGRGTPLGNPFKLGSALASRERVIAAYRMWLDNVLHGRITRRATLQAFEALVELAKLGENLALVCPGNCRPALPCHGDVLKEFLDRTVTGASI